MEFSPNLTYLGKKGTLNTASGLVVGYLSGVEMSENSDQEQPPPLLQPFEFSEASVDELLLPVRAHSGFLGVDLLLTSMWPAQVSEDSISFPDSILSGVWRSRCP